MSAGLTSSQWANTSRHRTTQRDSIGRPASSSSSAEISAFIALASNKSIASHSCTSTSTVTAPLPTTTFSRNQFTQPSLLPPSHNPPSTSTNPNTTNSRITDLQSSQRLLRRLKWKANLLLLSHSYATTAADHERSFAETQFKLDFFEFFVLLERVLVHLLACLHISVPRSSANFSSRPATSPERRNGSSHAGGSGAAGGRKNIYTTRGHIPIYNTHRFHAHLLETLDRPSNPLHPCLGIGDVRMYLGVAKDCRNKWKDAGDRERANNHDNGNEPIGTRDTHPYDPPPETYTVASLNLSTMLPAILLGLDRAMGVVEAVVRELPEGMQGSVVLREDGAMDLDMEEDWEGVVDGLEDVEMEWE